MELLGLTASDTNVVAGLAPGVPLAGFIQVFTPLEAPLLLLLNYPRGFMLACMNSDGI